MSTPPPARIARLLRTMVVVATAALVVAGCGSESSAPTTGAPATVATSAPPDPGPPDCSDARLEGDLGTIGFAACDDEWAAVQPASYTDACIDCETLWLARWTGTRWNLHARCHRDTVLMPDRHGCSAVTGTFDAEVDTGEVRELPPVPTACAIWEFNKVEESLAATGCPEQ